LSGQAVTCATHPVCRKFGLHKFRHTFATNFLRDGGDIRTLQKILGHSNLETTMLYVHALDAEDTGDFVEKSTLANLGGPRAAVERAPQALPQPA
jgi:integrase/recombinase XerD